MLLVLNLSGIEFDIVLLSSVSVYIVQFDLETSSSVHSTCLLSELPFNVLTGNYVLICTDLC